MLTNTYILKIESCVKLIEVFKFSSGSIYKKYQDQKFSESNILKKDLFSSIINKKISDNHLQYLESKCEGLSHHMDRRKPYEYAVDLILGWLAEDALLNFLQENNIKSALEGNDRFREFLTARKISTQPDIKIFSQSGDVRLLEFMCDWKDTWNTKGHLDLRDNKYIKLENEKAIFLGVSPLSLNGFVIDFMEEQQDWIRRYNPAYGKQVYTYEKIKQKMRPLKDTLVLLNKI